MKYSSSSERLPHPSKKCKLKKRLKRKDKFNHFYSPLMRTAVQAILDDDLTTHYVDINFHDKYALKVLKGKKTPIDVISRILVDKFKNLGAEHIIIVLESCSKTEHKLLHSHCITSSPCSSEDIRRELQRIRFLAPSRGIHINSGVWMNDGQPQPLSLGKADYITKQVNLPHRPKGERKVYMSLKTRQAAALLYKELYEAQQQGIHSNVCQPDKIREIELEKQPDNGDRISYVSDQSAALDDHKSSKSLLLMQYKELEVKKDNLEVPNEGEKEDVNQYSVINPSKPPLTHKEFIQHTLSSNTDECILWPFQSKNRQGYPVTEINGKTVRVNRYICTKTHGNPPTDKHHAAHTCGKRICANPKHIEWKTAKDNLHDKISHGTNGRKLSTENAIRVYCTVRGIPAKALAKHFGLTERTIHHIRSVSTWRPLLEPSKHIKRKMELSKSISEKILSTLEDSPDDEDKLNKVIEASLDRIAEIEAMEKEKGYSYGLEDPEVLLERMKQDLDSDSYAVLSKIVAEAPATNDNEARNMAIASS